jgi:hypothetical protein
MNIRIPQALVEEHRTLLAEIEKATHEGGLVGEAAIALKAAVVSHIERDNNVVLPVLGLLSAVVHDQLDVDLGEISHILDRVRVEIPKLASEHKSIQAAANRLGEVARHENKPEYISFAFQLWLHMDEEEAVYYPAAQLVEAFIRIRHALDF